LGETRRPQRSFDERWRRGQDAVRDRTHGEAGARAHERAGGRVPGLHPALEVGVEAPHRGTAQVERRRAETAAVAHVRPQARDDLALPGFTNAHHRMRLTALQLGTFEQPLETMLAARRRFRGVDPYLDTLYAAFAMSGSGVRTVQHTEMDRLMQPSAGLQGELRVDGEAWRERVARCLSHAAQPVQRRPGALGIDVIGGDRGDPTPVVNASGKDARRVVGEIGRGLHVHPRRQQQPS